jgi:hypothetical protein
MHLGATGAAVVGLVEKDRAVPVEHPRSLAAFMDDSAELVEQSGRLQRELSIVVMDVEPSALSARIRRRIGLVDGGGDAVDVQNASQGQPTRAGANDGDRSHRASLSSRRPLGDVALRLWNTVP